MSVFPKVPGPKLKPFQSPSVTPNIKFIERLGKGVHGHVWKVQIDGSIYAMKIVGSGFLYM